MQAFTPMRPQSQMLRSQRLQSLVAELIEALGEDLERPGLARTPARVARAFLDLTSGYTRSPEEALGDAVFDAPGDGMVLVRDIEFHSLCEHHLLPFTGVAHVAYLPAGRVVGLSKLPRLVDLYARRLQLQERLTAQVADALGRLVEPHGVAVAVDATHSCMGMRGVQQQRARTRTVEYRGRFLEQADWRREFHATLR
jgi:GTP cyclohydrolase I